MPKTYEQVMTKQALNRVTAKSMPFSWSINPYRGCTHGCSFCYARAFQSFIGLGAEDEFQNHILMKMNAAEALEAQLSKIAKRYGQSMDKISRHTGVVAIGTATDPYQPIEGKAQLTRECLKVLARYGVPTTITTRSPLILRDLDVLKDMRIASINISVNTLSREITRKFEPATPFPMKRLEAMENLAKNGIRTGVFIAPILPYLTDAQEDLASLFAAAKQHGAAFAMTSMLRLSAEVKAWYFQTLRKHYPQLVSAYLKLYSTAYAPRDYTDLVMRRADALKQAYGLTGGPSDITPPSLKPDSPEFNEGMHVSSGGIAESQPEQLCFQFS